MGNNKKYMVIFCKSTQEFIIYWSGDIKIIISPLPMVLLLLRKADNTDMDISSVKTDTFVNVIWINILKIS